ncbi:MAG: hypothetical protein K2X77_20805 [Candidatus Obscuribacterales bacterium]|nr:hypothetical protein [Candidatus Obscuribacterales bacterium]
MSRSLLLPISMLMLATTIGSFSLPAFSQPLKGRIETEDYRLHHARPAEPTRIQRGIPAQAQPDNSSPVDSNAFAEPLQGRADTANLKSGAVQSEDFARLPKGFDIGADKGSKELVLAWEKWHKQLAGAIYQIWNGRANAPGRAVLRVTVYRNRTIIPEIITCSPNPDFRRSIMSVFADINGNPGLTFPAKSERDKVSFEAEYIAGSNVDPGFSWLKGDVERIKKDY